MTWQPIKLPHLIDLKKLYEVRDDEKKNIDKMTISQIGKAVGAQQVLYVDLLRFGEIEGGSCHALTDRRHRSSG